MGYISSQDFRLALSFLSGQEPAAGQRMSDAEELNVAVPVATSARKPERRDISVSPCVGLYEVVRRARVRAECKVSSIAIGFLPIGTVVEVVETRGERMKFVFQGEPDWAGRRRCGWTSLFTPSRSALLIPVQRSSSSGRCTPSRTANAASTATAGAAAVPILQ